MSTILKISGIVIALIGIFGMYATVMGSANETIEAGLMVPTVPNIMKTTPVFIGEAIVMFIGLGIFALGVKICRSAK